MNKNELIITHPGGAHFDDVTALSLIIASFPDTDFTVERREPKDAELDDPSIWVIDVGDRYEPEKRNFDHHQSLDCPAAFVQVAGFLGLSDTMAIMPWWYFKDEVDRFGPVKSSLKFDAGDEMVNRNPAEEWLTTAFAAAPQATVPILKSYGSWLIENARQIARQIELWRSSRKLDIAGVPAIINEVRDSTGLEEFRRIEKDPPDIVISMDRRDEGWRLFRYEHVPVDFTRIADRAEIAFAHKTGFLAKTKEKIPVDDLIELVRGAVIPENERRS